MKLPTLITAILLVLAAPMAAAQVYKVVDKDGKVTYTDKPPASNADAPMTLPPLNTQPGMQLPPPREEAQPPEAAGYRRVAILQPPPGLTIPPGQLDLVVQVDLEPGLQPGHLVSILLDGNPVGRPAAATTVRIDNLVRGAHQIEAIILDDRGRRITASAPVEFFVQRTSRLTP